MASTRGVLGRRSVRFISLRMGGELGCMQARDARGVRAMHNSWGSRTKPKNIAEPNQNGKKLMV